MPPYCHLSNLIKQVRHSLQPYSSPPPNIIILLDVRDGFPYKILKKCNCSKQYIRYLHVYNCTLLPVHEPISYSHNYSHVMIHESENTPPKLNISAPKHRETNKTLYFLHICISQTDQIASREEIMENILGCLTDVYKHPSGTTYVLRKLNPNGRDNSKA